MTTLTKIRPVRNADWVVLVLDDDERLPIPTSALLAHALGPGDTLDSATLSRLRTEAESAHARTAALHLVGFRARSRQELETRLRKKGHAAAPIENALLWLEERGYLDDEAFAVAFVRDRIRFRPRGRRALVSELFGKGVRGELAEKAIARALELEELTFDDLALTVAQKWLRARSGRAEAGARDPRLYAHLQRKGFAGGAIRYALDALDAVASRETHHSDEAGGAEPGR
jgi:regulatory protein